MAVAESPTTYRFAAFGARGTVTLYQDRVHVKRITYLGRWEETVPLAHLSPLQGTLFATPQLYFWCWILALPSLALGVWGLVYGAHDVLRITFCLGLIAVSCWAILYLVRNRRNEWAVFRTPGCGGYVSFTRQGPDRDRFEAFCSMLKERIELQRSPP